MAKKRLSLDFRSVLRREKAQRDKYASLSIAEKLRIMDQLHDNALYFNKLRKKNSINK